MKVFDYAKKYGHEEIVFCHDEASGLRAVIAIHDSTLGPPNGGTRRWVYKSEDDAIEDALRLSISQSYKQAAAGLNGGGAMQPEGVSVGLREGGGNSSAAAAAAAAEEDGIDVGVSLAGAVASPNPSKHLL